MVSAADGREDLMATRRCTSNDRIRIYETLMQHVLYCAVKCSVRSEHPVAAARFLGRHLSASGLDECGDTYCDITTGHDTVSFS